MKNNYKKILAVFLSLTMFISSSSSVFANSQSNYRDVSEFIELNNGTNYNSKSIPSNFDGVDLFRTNFDVSKMSKREKVFYDYLLEKEANNYLFNSNSKENKADVKREIDLIIKNGISDKGNIITLYRSAPWWHFNTVSKVGSALDAIIGAAIAYVGGGIAAGGVRALIAKVGKSEAKKIVKNKVVNKVKNTLIAWGMSKISGKVSGALLGIIMWTTEPGTAIAELIDENDYNPNNGYIELF